MCGLLVRCQGKGMPIGRTGEPLKSQLVSQSVGNRVTSLFETANVCLEGLEQNSAGGRFRQSSVEVSLVHEGCASRQDCVPQSRRCDARPCVEPRPRRNVNRELLRHVTTSQPIGKSPRLEAPPARCLLQTTHRRVPGRRTPDLSRAAQANRSRFEPIRSRSLHPEARPVRRSGPRGEA